MSATPHIAPAIAAIEDSLREADRYCDQYHMGVQEDADWVSFGYYVERAFIELLVLSDRLNLADTYQRTMKEYEEAKKSGFAETSTFEDEKFSRWTTRIRLFTDAIAASYGLAKTSQSEVNELKAMLKRAVYVICDTAVFEHEPTNEAEVHARLEAILKCHYQDLKTKPSLTKPIKNFEPDTGLPSAKTLLEYKFISNKRQAKLVADQILADASGYRSREWTNLLFVIYETKRVLPEHEWQSLLKDCQLLEGFDVVVLSGGGHGAS